MSPCRMSFADCLDDFIVILAEVSVLRLDRVELLQPMSGLQMTPN